MNSPVPTRNRQRSLGAPLGPGPGFVPVRSGFPRNMFVPGLPVSVVPWTTARARRARTAEPIDKASAEAKTDRREYAMRHLVILPYGGRRIPITWSDLFAVMLTPL